MEQQQLSQLFAHSLTTSPHVQKSVAAYVDYTDTIQHNPPSIITVWAALFLFTMLGTPLSVYLFTVAHA